MQSGLLQWRLPGVLKKSAAPCEAAPELDYVKALWGG